jgi:dTDP-4-amino-4,6-dideoxygalactose transaminase
MSSAHQVTRDFEAAIAEYTAAPHVVAVNSCTMALLLAVAWHVGRDRYANQAGRLKAHVRPYIEIPRHTYVGVPMSIVHAGGWPTFREEDWGGKGCYQLKPLPVWDCARLFTSNMYAGMDGDMLCVSFHATKTLGIEQGGAILLNDPLAAEWLRRMRFDGRTAGIPVQQDRIREIGWHAYMNPSTAAQGLMRMAGLPKHNDPLPMSDYPDLSQMEAFK